MPTTSSVVLRNAWRHWAAGASVSLPFGVADALVRSGRADYSKTATAKTKTIRKRKQKTDTQDSD